MYASVSTSAAFVALNFTNEGIIMGAEEVQNFMTVVEAAKLIGISRRRVLQLLDLGVIAGEKLNPRMWLVNRKSAEAFRKKPAPKVGRPRKTISGC